MLNAKWHYRKYCHFYVARWRCRGCGPTRWHRLLLLLSDVCGCFFGLVWTKCHWLVHFSEGQVRGLCRAECPCWPSPHLSADLLLCSLWCSFLYHGHVINGTVTLSYEKVEDRPQCPAAFPAMVQPKWNHDGGFVVQTTRDLSVSADPSESEAHQTDSLSDISFCHSPPLHCRHFCHWHWRHI